MFCTNCGNKLNTGDSFCTECGSKVSSSKSTNSGKTVKIIVTRKKRAIGCAIPFPVYIDGEKIGQLTNGISLEKEVTVGSHAVEFVCADGNIRQDVELTESHESVEVLCTARMGLIAARVSILEVIYK